MATTERLTFSRSADGTVRLVGGWPATAVFSRHLLGQAESRFVRYADDRIAITVENAAALYRVRERDEREDTVTATLVWFRGPGAAQQEAEEARGDNSVS